MQPTSPGSVHFDAPPHSGYELATSYLLNRKTPFGAEFVEIQVHARTREIRLVGAFAAGRIVAPTTAKSHLMGGLIWGVSSALHEATEIDRRRARYYNTDFAEYLIPVNADIEEAWWSWSPRRATWSAISGSGGLPLMTNELNHAPRSRVLTRPKHRARQTGRQPD